MMASRSSSCCLLITAIYYIALSSSLSLVHALTILPKTNNDDGAIQHETKETRTIELSRNTNNIDTQEDILPRQLDTALGLTESSSRHSISHTVLSTDTAYSGNITSSSIELSIENIHDNDSSSYVIVSGLGLHIDTLLNVDSEIENVGVVSAAAADDSGSRRRRGRILKEENDSTINNYDRILQSNNSNEDGTPCYIKIYTKSYPSSLSKPIITQDELTSYNLSLETRALCKGKGQVTLLGSDYFIRNYRTNYDSGEVEESDYLHEGDLVIEGENVTHSEEVVEEEEVETQEVVTEEVEVVEGGRRKLVTTMNGEHVEIATPRILQDEEEVVETEDTGSAVETQETTTPVDEEGETQDSTTPSTTTNVLSEEDKEYPFLIAPNTTLSLYIQVMPAEDTPDGTSFSLLSTDAASDTEEDEAVSSSIYKSDTSINIYTGSSIVNDPTNMEVITSVTSPIIFNIDVYYDIIDSTTSTDLHTYYNELEYSLLPGGGYLNLPGCDDTFNTGYIDTIGSYGLMFDVQSAIKPEDTKGGDELTDAFKNIEIYGMELYMRNLVTAEFEIYIRKNMEGNGAKGTQYPNQVYTSYQATGQTEISSNWELIAEGTVEGQGPDVGSPLPLDSWKKVITLRPGEIVGFYVTVKHAPDLRYRNTTLAEGDVYATNGILNVGVGRSWGEWPLREDGTDVYFEPREFSGGFLYHVHEGLCESTMPSVAPTWSLDSPAPSTSPAPTAEHTHTYEGKAKEDGTCPEEGSLETTFQDGTGSYGSLFDVMAKTDVTVTGIDLNIDWNSGTPAHVLVYARQGSWFGHQNNADSWSHLLVDTTIYRPDGFHDREIDGPYIPVETKRGSAIIPSSVFEPLEMKIGETWAFYVCISLADLRYTLGSSIGKTFASNNELRIMEGAGAADYPPFGGSDPEAGGTEYTFYAPRVFNGQLRYDYVDVCPSQAPSSFEYTDPPTPTPTLTTSVSYTFYVEHDPELLNGEITYDMSFGVRSVLDKFLDGDEEIRDELLHGHKNDDKLVIENIVAKVTSPSSIGYVCVPVAGMTCTPISVDVTATHLSTATSDDVLYAFLRKSEELPTRINVDGYTMSYVGDRAVETNSEIVLSGVPDRLMGESEQEYFASVAKDFLANQVVEDSENDSLHILSVTVNGQEITTADAVSSNTLDESAMITPEQEVRDIPLNRQLQEKANNIQVSVKATYRPPPELDFGELVETSINRDRELLQKELNKPPELQEGEELVAASSYFENTDVVGAREIKEETKALPPPVLEDDDGMDSILQYTAMGIGGLIGLLSIIFFLRPHRRQAMFSSEDTSAHRRTQQVDVEDQGLLKNRAMIRGDTFNDSEHDSSYYDDDKKLRGSGNSSELFNPRLSNSSSDGYNPRGSANLGGPQTFNPRGSANSGYAGGGPIQQQGFNPRGSNNSGGSGGSGGGGYPPQGFNPNASVNSGRQMSMTSGSRYNPNASVTSGRQPSIASGMRQPSIQGGVRQPSIIQGGVRQPSIIQGGVRQQSMIPGGVRQPSMIPSGANRNMSMPPQQGYSYR